MATKGDAITMELIKFSHFLDQFPKAKCLQELNHQVKQTLVDMQQARRR